MSDGMFRTVSRLRSGYDPDEVDEFFDHARQLYEQGPGTALSAKDVRRVGFEMVRGGYATAAVDAALDRFGRMLERHVRREEREYYQRVQEVLDDASMRELGVALGRHLVFHGKAVA